MLPGTKILVQGNHDIFNLDDPSFRHSFTKVKSYMDIVDNGRRVVLTHYPIEDWNEMMSLFDYMISCNKKEGKGASV